MDYAKKVEEDAGRTEPACQICKSAAVTRVPVRALKPQTVRRYVFGKNEPGQDIALCGVCTLLHCEETFEGDGPTRAPRESNGPLSGCYDDPDYDPIPQLDTDSLGITNRPYGPGGRAYDYAVALLRVLERSGYHIYLRSDGRQLILSHEDGLDRQTRGQVERYRKEITEVIIDRLWQNGAGC